MNAESYPVANWTDTENIDSSKTGSKPSCSICLDKSSGFHYGTHACEGCKGFFRRMVTNSILIQLVLQCTGSNTYKCEITPSTRNNCQRCRLQKCFQMGMTRYKTRLGRRTKAIALKLENKALPRIVNSFLSDEDMLKLIKRENKIFNNSEIEEEEQEVPLAKCVKYKAKLYSEKNCKYYQKYPTIPEIKELSTHNNRHYNQELMFAKASNNSKPFESFENFDLNKNSFDKMNSNNNQNSCSDHSTNDSEFDLRKPFDNNQSMFSNSSLASVLSSSNSLGLEYDRRQSSNNEESNCATTMLENKHILFAEKIKLKKDKFQIENLCSKIRVFRNCNSSNEDYLHFFNCKATISTLTDYFYHPNLEEMEEYYRTRVDQVSYVYNPLLVFTEMTKELSEMSRKIFAFFKRLPDLELFELITIENSYIKKKIIQTLAVWLIRFVNVSENLIYNTTLSMKIPLSVLLQTPLNHFFELLFHLAEICNSFLTMEIDDMEISLISALIITFPRNESINCSETMLQPDNILKVRFLYCASLYDHIFTERCTHNHDCTENRLQKLCWLISESDILNENDVNHIFSHFTL